MPIAVLQQADARRRYHAYVRQSICLYGLLRLRQLLLVLDRNASSNRAKSILAFDILGSALFAAGHIAFGLFLADRFGFDLLTAKAE